MYDKKQQETRPWWYKSVRQASLLICLQGLQFLLPKALPQQFCWREKAEMESAKFVAAKDFFIHFFVIQAWNGKTRSLYVFPFPKPVEERLV